MNFIFWLVDKKITSYSSSIKINTGIIIDVKSAIKMKDFLRNVCIHTYATAGSRESVLQRQKRTGENVGVRARNSL